MQARAGLCQTSPRPLSKTSPSTLRRPWRPLKGKARASPQKAMGARCVRLTKLASHADVRIDSCALSSPPRCASVPRKEINAAGLAPEVSKANGPPQTTTALRSGTVGAHLHLSVLYCHD